MTGRYPCLLQKWVAYELLLALVQCHERGVCHGDIKSENTMLTSWNWVYLVDFAPYKPTALPADNPVSCAVGGAGGVGAHVCGDFSCLPTLADRQLTAKALQEPTAAAGAGERRSCCRECGA